MVIKKINEFYYDENIRHYLFIMSNLKTNKQKLQFLHDMQIVINSIPDKNITAIRLLDTLQLMYKAVQNKEKIILEGWKAFFFQKNIDIIAIL